MALRSSRRAFLRASSALAVSSFALQGCSQSRSPAIAPASRPGIPLGVSSGDVTDSSAIIWSKSDRPARMFIDWSTVESMKDAVTVAGPSVSPETDFTGKLDLRDLPPGQRVFYRVRFVDASNPQVESEPQIGTFQTAPLAARDVRFAWSGDTAGQGWGINPAIGGMPIYRVIRDLAPDFFIHSGDTIYADIPILPEVVHDDGTIWRNITTPAKSKVAETLDEFRGNHAYNLLDENIRRFNASIPIYYQWDDHEVMNNWYPGKITDDPRYKIERRLSVLAERARRAFLEYLPIRSAAGNPPPIHRHYAYGPLAEVFILDQRSFRAKNSANTQPVLDDASAWMGVAQIKWLKEALARSKAVWKIIASDMPLGYICGDVGGTFENCANGNHGAPLGRELEIADLLSFMKQQKIRNAVWLTADVHHASSVRYEPDRAAFKDFDGFWEFVTGPLHAGTFGPNSLDRTFGPKREWLSLPQGLKGGRNPADGYQFFGIVSIDAKSKALKLEHYDIKGKMLKEHVLEAVE